MKRALLVVLILSLSLLAACQPITLEEAEAQFCEDLSTFMTAMSAYRELDATSTLDEVNQAQKLVASAYDDLRSSAQALRTVQINEMYAEYDALQQAIRDLEGDMTVGAAAAEIDAAVDAIDASAEEVYSTSCAM